MVFRNVNLHGNDGVKKTAFEFFGGYYIDIPDDEPEDDNILFHGKCGDKYAIIPKILKKEQIVNEMGFYQTPDVSALHNFFRNEYPKEEVSRKFSSLEKINIIIEKDLDFFISQYSYPAYWLRGKTLTREQALNIISNVDKIFYVKNKDYVETNMFSTDWFGEKTRYGWCRPDGRVGLDATAVQNSTINTYIVDGINLLHHFPYVDLVFIVWGSYGEKLFDDKLADMLSSKIGDYIDFGVHIHDNTIEILNGNRAWKLFKKYNNLYGQSPVTYMKDYYYVVDEKVCDIEYLEKCLQINRINPELKNDYMNKIIYNEFKSYSYGYGYEQFKSNMIYELYRKSGRYLILDKH